MEELSDEENGRIILFGCSVQLLNPLINDQSVRAIMTYSIQVINTKIIARI